MFKRLFASRKSPRYRGRDIRRSKRRAIVFQQLDTRQLMAGDLAVLDPILSEMQAPIQMNFVQVGEPTPTLGGVNLNPEGKPDQPEDDNNAEESGATNDVQGNHPEADPVGTELEDIVIDGSSGTEGEVFVFFGGGEALPSIDGVRNFLTDEESAEYAEAERLIKDRQQLERDIAALNETIVEQAVEKELTQEGLTNAQNSQAAAQERFEQARRDRDAAAERVSQLNRDLESARDDLDRSRQEKRTAIDRRGDLLGQLFVASQNGADTIPLERALNTVETEIRRANGAAVSARENIEEISGQLPAAEADLMAAEAALEKARTELETANHELLVAESAAALACTRLMESESIRDRMVERSGELGQEINRLRESIADAIDRATARMAEYNSLQTQIDALLEAKSLLQTRHDALASLIGFLRSNVGTDIPPDVRDEISDKENETALENAAEVFSTLGDLLESVKNGPGIGTVIEVVKIGGTILTDSAVLLAEAKQHLVLKQVLADFLNSDQPPRLSNEFGEAIRDFILINRDALAAMTGNRPPDSDDVGQQLQWLHQNALAVAIGMARFGKHPGAPIEPDNIYNNIAINYLEAQCSQLQNAIEGICGQIESLRHQQNQLKR